MSERGQRVVVIQDGSSKDLCTSALRWALQGLYLKPPRDKVTLLAIIQPFKSSSSTMGCGLLRYKRRLDSSATLKKKQELVDREIAKKRDEYHNNAEIKDIIKLYETKQIEFQIIVESGHSLKDDVVRAAKNLGATCVILDRGMKKDRKYMMENLTCGILRLQHDNNIEHLRESTTIDHDHDLDDEHTIQPIQQETRHEPQISYKEFTYEELKVATNYFSPENLLSKGDDDCKKVYRGKLPNGMEIIIKEHTFFSDMVRKHTSKSIKLKEFRSEVQTLGKARHDNIVLLLGSCSQHGLRLLVYQYVCADTSLDHYLSRKTEELTWEARLKVAAEAAKGLQYLHRNNIYGNVRSHNIFITHDHHPLVGNFGLTRNQYEEESSDQRSGVGDRVMRTFEYLPPEYEDTGRDSPKSDIYSFGVVLLELITGRRTIDQTRGLTFLRWARPLLEEKKYGELIDPMVLESHDLHQFLWMVRVVEKCLSWDPHRRPSIDKMVTTLSRIAQGCNVISPPDSQEGSEE